ncbi:MAG: hypothetical protein V2I33_23610, partial [Kangiellaceae bacterium]|nr:hypothetical protein [Kangiellaceae bacterium]
SPWAVLRWSVVENQLEVVLVEVTSISVLVPVVESMGASWVDLTETELWLAVLSVQGTEELNVEELLEIADLTKPDHVGVDVVLNGIDLSLWVVNWWDDVRQSLVIPEVQLLSQTIMVVGPIFSHETLIAVLRPAAGEVNHVLSEEWWDGGEGSSFSLRNVALNGVVLILDLTLKVLISSVHVKDFEHIVWVLAAEDTLAEAETCVLQHEWPLILWDLGDELLIGCGLWINVHEPEWVHFNGSLEVLVHGEQEGLGGDSHAPKSGVDQSVMPGVLLGKPNNRSDALILTELDTPSNFLVGPVIWLSVNDNNLVL